MKKAVSIVLLMMLSLTFVHATLTWHFCGNELSSFGVGGQKPACCCAAEANAHTQGIHADSCCADYTLTISTDEFSLQQPATTHETAGQTFVLLPQTVEYQSCQFAVAQAVFPPPNSGFAPSGTDLLASICVFRI